MERHDCKHYLPATLLAGWNVIVCVVEVHLGSANNYHLEMKFAKVMFLQVSVCSRGRGLCQGGLCPGGCLCPGDISVQGTSLSRGEVSIQGWGLYPGGSMSRGSLSRGLCSGASLSMGWGLSPGGVSVQEASLSEEWGSLSMGMSLSRVMSLSRGISVQGWGSLSRGLCPGVSIQGGLYQGDFCLGDFCPGGLCPGGSLSRGYGYVRVVSILLECILLF